MSRRKGVDTPDLDPEAPICGTFQYRFVPVPPRPLETLPPPDLILTLEGTQTSVMGPDGWITVTSRGRYTLTWPAKETP